MNENLNQKIRGIELPQRLRHRPISEEGYPVPWFVPKIDGKWDFRAMDGEKLGQAVRRKLCWLCGEPTGRHLTFAIGPMCCITRTIAEPPSHHSCAHYAVKACPFLTQPKMRRNEKDVPEGHIAGYGLKRNPGVACLWVTADYKMFRAPNGGVLFSLGDPERVEFYAQGRPATRAEIMESITSGLPTLQAIAADEGTGAVMELSRRVGRAMNLIPQETAA